jgi:hypothetical protein
VDPKHRPPSTIPESQSDNAQSLSPQQIENLKFQTTQSLQPCSKLGGPG